MKPVLRRTFLKLAAETGMALSLGGCWLLEPSRPEAGRCVTRGTVPDTDFDYIVIGSGTGGGELLSPGLSPVVHRGSEPAMELLHSALRQRQSPKQGHQARQ